MQGVTIMPVATIIRQSGLKIIAPFILQLEIKFLLPLIMKRRLKCKHDGSSKILVTIAAGVFTLEQIEIVEVCPSVIIHNTNFHLMQSLHR